MADFRACVISKFYVWINRSVGDFNYWFDFTVILVAM